MTARATAFWAPNSWRRRQIWGKFIFRQEWSSPLWCRLKDQRISAQDFSLFLCALIASSLAWSLLWTCSSEKARLLFAERGTSFRLCKKGEPAPVNIATWSRSFACFLRWLFSVPLLIPQPCWKRSNIDKSAFAAPFGDCQLEQFWIRRKCRRVHYIGGKCMVYAHHTTFAMQHSVSVPKTEQRC